MQGYLQSQQGCLAHTCSSIPLRKTWRKGEEKSKQINQYRKSALDATRTLAETHSFLENSFSETGFM